MHTADEWITRPQRRDGITISKFQLAIAFSVLLHVAALWQWRIEQNKPPDNDVAPPLTVKLLPLPPLPGPAPGIATPSPVLRKPPVTPPPRMAAAEPTLAPSLPQAANPAPKAAPPVLAIEPPAAAPMTVPPRVADAATPAPPRTPPPGDFATFLEAQRRARGESAPPAAAPAEDENARATRLAIANLATPKAQGFGGDPNRSGGIFTMKHKGVDYAEFMFYGWHADARRDLAQLVEVRKGSHPTIELAVVRRMIEIIREHVQGDFPWRSHRLNRVITLSARQRDSANLEEFLMREFFYNPRIAP